MTPTPLLNRIGVPRVVNAAGIYTDLGGSTLAPAVWAAAREINDHWAGLPQLLDATGARIAELVGAEAARVVPGASAAIALAVASQLAAHDPDVTEALPLPAGPAKQVLIQRGHRYNYQRCVMLAGARLTEVGSDRVEAGDIGDAAGPDVCALLFPAHLESTPGTLSLEDTVAACREHDIPVIVDAAYMSYPVELVGSYTARGADLACFSAKYFYGPNAGGFITGTARAIAQVRHVDFTEYESGPWRHFGRALKMDRVTVVATMLALEEWLAMDHETRWAEYARRVDGIRAQLEDLPGIDMNPVCFTLQDVIGAGSTNALAVRSALGGAAAIVDIEKRLAEGNPSIVCSRAPDALVLFVECLALDDEPLLISRLRRAWSDVHVKATA